MNNDTVDFPARSGRKNGLRHYAGVHRVLGSTSGPYTICTIQSQFIGSRRGNFNNVFPLSTVYIFC